MSPAFEDTLINMAKLLSAESYGRMVAVETEVKLEIFEVAKAGGVVCKSVGERTFAAKLGTFCRQAKNEEQSGAAAATLQYANLTDVQEKSVQRAMGSAPQPRPPRRYGLGCVPSRATSIGRLLWQ